MEKEKINIVWLKRDLRINDHYPLWEASRQCAEQGIPALAVYCLEKEYWDSNKASDRQKTIVMESLSRMAADFHDACQGVIHLIDCRIASEAIAHLSQQYQIHSILTHQETHNLWTFKRDVAVDKIATEIGSDRFEWLQNGVKRAWHPANWSEWWKAWVEADSAAPPTFWKSPKNAPIGAVPVSTNAAGHPSEAPEATLLSFLTRRCLTGEGYRIEMGGGELAAVACSRISQHITWGGISNRDCAQTAATFMANLQRPGKEKQIQAFISRLAWRDNFIQQFEANHHMEFLCLNPSMENVRNDDPVNLQRFVSGETGYPYVDACMRCLSETGWITFRARALLVSFASYALNLDWRAFGPHLARNFIDYEPGIHYCQLQMQAGTAMKSPPRIYNPLKQSVEKDPNGNFIRTWVPELRSLSKDGIHIPGNPAALAAGYPAPAVASNRLQKVMRSHGPKKTKEKEQNQIELDFS